MPTAAAIIIGNEILSAKFADENGPWLIKRCRELGIDLTRVSIISDDVDVIADEVRSVASSVDYVFTTGGIGPTHDDLTMLGIAAAFDVELVTSPVLKDMIEARMGADVNEEALSMAKIPDGADLWQENPVKFPVVVCRNVLIFPGVPAYLRAKFDDIAPRLGGVPLQSRKLVTEQHEPEIAATLRTAAENWPSVTIGSYPRFETNPPSVIVALDGRDTESLDACYQWLRGQIKAT